MARMEFGRWDSGRIRLHQTGDRYTLLDTAGQRFELIGDELHALADVVNQAERARRRAPYEVGDALQRGNITRK